MLKFGITLLNLMISFAKKFSIGWVSVIAAGLAIPAAAPLSALAQGLSAVEAAGRTSEQIGIPQRPFDATATRTPSPEAAAASAAAAERAAQDAPIAVDDTLNLNPAEDDFAGRRALLERQQAWANYRFEQAKYDCASRFFVNACIDRARDKQREELKAIRSQRLVLDDAERRARADERDARLAARRADEAAQAPQRAAERAKNVSDYQSKQDEYQQRVTQRTGEAPQRAANQQQYNAKQAEQQQKLDDAKATSQQKAAERAENVRKYNEKQQEAIERQKKSDERRSQSQEGDKPASKALGQ